MAIELAAAYVTIVPSLKGATKQIQDQLAGIDTSVGTGLGKQLSDKISAGANFAPIAAKFESIGSALSGVGAKMSSNITKPAVVAGGAVATLVGALGFKRLVGIDTARGQFKGLGHDADAVMAQVDKGVTNTALSMADGASLAVGILATGNLPLEKLEGQLKRVANVSAAYGVDASQAGYLLNNVLTKNKVTYGDLSQMVQNQIPIISMLADHYGVTGDEIEKMAGRGEISIEDFNKVLDSNAGAAAEEYAKTWKGVTSNIMSNIGKMGAQILDSVFPQMKAQLGEFLELLKSDDAKAFASDVGKTLGEAFTALTETLKSAVTWWNGLSPAMQSSIGKLALVAIVAGPVLSVFGKITSGIGLFVAGLGKTVGAVSKFSGALKSGFQTMQIVGMYAGDAIKAAGSGIKSGAQAVGVMAKMQLQYVAAAGRATATAVAQGAVFLAQKTAMVATTVATKAAAAGQWLLNAAMSANPITLIVLAIAALVAGLIYFFTQTELGQEIWANFTQFLTEAWANITTFLSEAWTNIVGFFTSFGESVSGVWTGLWTSVGTFLSETWENIKSFFASALQFVVDLFMNWTVYGLIIKNWDSIKAFFANVWTGIKNVFSSATQWLTSTITGFLSTVKAGWTIAWSAISSFFSDVWNNIVGAAKGFGNGVKNVFTTVTDFVRGIPGTIIGFFVGIGTTLLDSGRALIQGFLDGIAAGFENAKKWVSDGLGAIRDLFPFSPAKTGPFSGRGWVLYSGLSLGTTFTGAIADSLSNGRAEVASEMDGIEEEFQRIEDFANGTEFSVRSAVPDSGSAGAARPGVQVNNAISMYDRDPRIVAKQIGRGVEEVLVG